MFYLNFINFYFFRNFKNFFKRNNFEYFLYLKNSLNFSCISPAIKFFYTHKQQRFDTLRFRGVVRINLFWCNPAKKIGVKKLGKQFFYFVVYGFLNVVRVDNLFMFYMFFIFCYKYNYITGGKLKPEWQEKKFKKQFLGYTYFNNVEKLPLFFNFKKIKNYSNLFFKNKLLLIYNIIFKPVNLLKIYNKNSLNLLNINFLRKNKVFNKSRYSRNRQYYRTGVYWCLYINIIAVFGFYFWFFKLTFNFSYLWWLLYLFMGSFFFSKTLNFNTINVFSYIIETFFWFFNLIYNIIFNNIISLVYLFFIKKSFLNKYYFFFIKK